MNRRYALMSVGLFALLLIPLLMITAAPALPLVEQQGGRLSGTATAFAATALASINQVRAGGANAAATATALSSGLGTTRQSANGQISAQATAFAATALASINQAHTGGLNAAATATALSSGLGTTRQSANGQISAQATAFAATARAAATQLHSAGANVAATATALVGTLQAAYNDLPAEVITFLDSFDGQVTYDYDQATGALTVSTYISEAYINEGADAVAATLGYSGDSVTVDLQSPDIAIVTVVDPASGATIVITIQVSVVDGIVNAVPLSLTINGHNAPINQIPAEYTAAANAAVQSQLDAIFAAAGIDYTLQSIYFDDGGATLTVTMSLM